MDYSKFITWGMSGLALFLAALSLYLQRRDKRPHLRATIERGYIESSGSDGKITYHPQPLLKIKVSNPTERTVKVISVDLLDTKKRHHTIPKHWLTFDEVPSHDRRILTIPIIEFNEWIKTVKFPNPEKGKFVITDALEYEYKTPALGKISLEPVNKL